MVEWRITNSVFTVKFDTYISLDLIAKELSKQEDTSVRYDPSEFSGLTLDLSLAKENKRIKVIIFSSGLMNITGLKDAGSSLISVIEKIKEKLSKAGVNLPDNYELKVTNITINGKFDYDYIDLEKMASELDEVKYEPDNFPGLITTYYISDDLKVTFTVFKNGKFVCTGIKGDISAINQHINEIVNSFQENVLKKYVKQ
jgi:TATA-box binding protein (TBP) (component of TFIID and TFIIIB)